MSRAMNAILDKTQNAVPATQPAEGTNARKVNDYFRSYLDEAAIDKAGLAPVEASLKDVDSVTDTGKLVGLMGHWQGVVRTPQATLKTLPGAPAAVQARRLAWMALSIWQKSRD